MQLNQLLTLALPIMSMLVSRAIQQNHWPECVNLLVATATIVAASVATMLVQGKLTGSVYGDILLVAGCATALQSDGIEPLRQYLRDHLCNFAPGPQPADPKPVPVPTALALPPGSTPVPPRASADQPRPGA